MASSEHETLLYVGKDDRFLDQLSRLIQLQENGFRLAAAKGVRQLQDYLQKGGIRAFLCDSSVLREGEKRLYEQVIRLAPKIPVVMLVNKDEEELGLKSLEQGAFDYIVKVKGALTALPFTLERIREFQPRLEEISFVVPEEEQLPELTSFFEINESSRFLTFDENLSEILGVPPDELYRSYLLDFISEEDRERFYEWRSSPKRSRENFYALTEIIHRKRGIVPVELQLSPYSRPEALFSGFRGFLRIRPEGEALPAEEVAAEKPSTSLVPFFREVYQLNRFLQQGLSQLFLMKLAELPKKHFEFEYAALFLYAPMRHEYQKELSIGSGAHLEGKDIRSDRFREEEIQNLFAGGEFVQFVHQSVLSDEERQRLFERPESALFQKKSWEPGQEWQPGNRLFLNLRNSAGETMGVVLLDRPSGGRIPPASVLEQAEIYAIVASGLLEGQQRYEKLETKYKQLKQIFTILETYSINLPLEGLLREIVWTIKFSLGFNLAAIAILSKSTRRLALKAIAVESKEKAHVLGRLRFTVEEISPLLRKNRRISHSYLVNTQNTPLQLIKRIYGLPLNYHGNGRFWQHEDLLLVPIRTRTNKIIGFFILDDPADHRRPEVETIRILEKIANLVSVTIENKLIYTQLKSNYQRLEYISRKGNGSSSSESSNRIRQILRRISLSL